MVKPSSGIRRRKRPTERQRDSRPIGGIDLLKSVESDLAGTSATSDHDTDQLIGQESDSSQEELVTSLTRKLLITDNRPVLADCQTSLVESGFQNLSLEQSRQQQRQHLHHRTSYTTKAVNVTSIRELNNNNDCSIDKRRHAKRIQRKKAAGCRTNWRTRLSSGTLQRYEETDHDHDGDIERSDNDGDDNDDGDDDYNFDSDELDDHDQLRLIGAQGRLGGLTEMVGREGGRLSLNISSDQRQLKLADYHADESFSPHNIDSDDKNSSTISACRSSDKPFLLLLRKLATIMKTATVARNKMMRDSDKLESGSECEACNCATGIQEQAEPMNHADSSSLLSRLGKIGSPRRNDNNNNNIGSGDRDCRCNNAKSQYRLGERASNFGSSSHQNRDSEPRVSAKCSESSLWCKVLSWIPSQLQPLIASNEGGCPQRVSSTSDTRRRKSRRVSAVELKNYQVSSFKRGDIESLKSAEWQKQKSEYIIGEDRGRPRTSNMPSNSNYGAGIRLPGTSSGVERKVATSSGRSTRRDSSRLYESNGYLRLGHSHYPKKSERSFLPELKRILLLLMIIAICGVVLWQIYELLVEETNFLGTIKFSPSILGHYNHYAVSTDAEPCAKIGKNLLAKGGHAIDAAIGTLICMGISLPNSLGLGGGCLMTIYDNVTKQAIVIDGRETAPDYATETMFANNPLSASRGPLSIGVPGELAAYWEAHQRFGRLPWPELFEESITMAEEGFATVEHLSAALRDMNHAQYITPKLQVMMTNNETGDYYREGELMRLPVMAATLRRIRDQGVKEFYEGETGRLLIDDLKLQGGKITTENLRNYKAIVRPATVIKLNNDLTAYTQPVPGSGLVLSIILRILKELGYYANSQPHKSFEASALFYHHLVEAFKFAYAQRAGLEDLPDDPARMEKLIAKISSDAFIKSAVEKISNSKTQPSEIYGGLEYFQPDHGTAHTSVIDNEGNSVAVTTSVNLYFGSGLVSPRTGIIFNDVMDDFTSPNLTNKFGLPPSMYNRIRPGRRPLSSMAPSVFVDSRGNPRLIVGASGGSKITSSIAIVVLRSLFFDEDLKMAIDGPRIHHQFLPDEVWYEANFAPETLASLKSRGHNLKLITGRSSVVMAIACNYTTPLGSKHITANSDYRKGGSVDGQ